MTADAVEIWAVILGLAAGTFLLRFSFLGLVGDRPLPGWLHRHLRYTPVAVLPALIAPLVLWPETASSTPEPARLLAATATLAVGWRTRHVAAAILAGLATLYAGIWLLGWPRRRGGRTGGGAPRPFVAGAQSLLYSFIVLRLPPADWQRVEGVRPNREET